MEMRELMTVGGTFGLVVSKGSGYPAYLGTGVRLVNARSAIQLLIRELSVKKAWLPSYLCETMLAPFLAEGTEVEFYPIDARLRLGSGDWLERVGENDLVAGINYFGLVGSTLGPTVAERGGVFLEDLSQALFEAPAESHYNVYSPRKFLPVLDGGVLCGPKAQAFAQPGDTAEGCAFYPYAVKASFGRALSDEGDDTVEWFGAFRQCEELMPISQTGMSAASSYILRFGTNFDAVRAARVGNYSMLGEMIAEYALLPVDPGDAVPLGFPIVVANRESLLKEFYSREVFPPVHWNLEGFVPNDFEESHRLSRTILTLPCDQRYGVAEMQMIAAIVTEFAEPLPKI